MRQKTLDELEHAIDSAVPISPQSGMQRLLSTHTIVTSYRALYFDFYYITDELIWYGIRSQAGRHAVALADLVYGVVFHHEIFSCLMTGRNKRSVHHHPHPHPHHHHPETERPHVAPSAYSAMSSSSSSSSSSSLLSSSTLAHQANMLETSKEICRLLPPWTRQLGYFLSFFPENQETTLPLRQLYEPLKESEMIGHPSMRALETTQVQIEMMSI